MGTPRAMGRPALRALVVSDTGRAAGLAVAVAVTNLISLAFTIVFARVLGATGYGSLAVLISAFIVLMVPGSALQIAAAREVSRAAAEGSSPGAGVRRWLRQLAIATLAVTALSIPLRDVIAAVVNVDQAWGAAALPLTAMLWMVVSVERGALQGFQRYRIVGLSLIGEASSRLAFGAALVAAGLGVTGAFLGTALSLVAIGLVLAVALSKRLPGDGERGDPLRRLLAGSGAPIAALTLLFGLQEVHVIVIKHELPSEAAGSYAVAAVAAKAIIWLAIGLGFYLLPEATRRAKQGVDARPVLLRTLGLIALAGAPMVVVYAAAGEPLLRSVFGEDLAAASRPLPWLGLAMSLLAASYLCVQYLLALGRAHFVLVLAVGVVAEVALLAAVGTDPTRVAIALFGLQTACAAFMLSLSARRVPEAEHPGAYLPV